MPQQHPIVAGRENSEIGFFGPIILTGKGSTGFLGVNDNYEPYTTDSFGRITHDGSYTFKDSYGQDVLVQPRFNPEGTQVLGIAITSESPYGSYTTNITNFGLTASRDPWGNPTYSYNGISLSTFKNLIGSNIQARQAALEEALSGAVDSLGIIRGGPKNDYLISYSGADNIYGGFGDDLIIGSPNSANLSGEQGSDKIYAQSKSIVCTSWADRTETHERDAVVASISSSHIRIMDFELMEDRIVIDGNGNKKHISFRNGSISYNGGRIHGTHMYYKKIPVLFLDNLTSEKRLLESVSFMQLGLEGLSPHDAFERISGI